MDIQLMKQLLEFFKSGQFLHQVHSGLDIIQRWEKFAVAGQFRKQSSFEHTLDTSFLAVLVIEKIALHYPAMNKYALLVCASLHELGEIKLTEKDPGDVLWEDKQNGNDYVLQELDVFFRITSKTLADEDMIDGLLELYLLQYNNDPGKMSVLIQDERVSKHKYILDRYGFEAKVFDAIEKLGYVLDIIRQYALTPSESFPLLLKVFHNQQKKLGEYSQEIKGFDYFYSPEIHRKILELLQDYPVDKVDKMLSA